MAEERRPMPQLTVRDPVRPAGPADVLVSGKDQPRPNPFTKRRLQALAAVVLVVAVAVGVAEVRERREARRLDRVLDLSVLTGGTSSSYDQRRAEAELTLRIEVRNDGPRDVVVLRGTAGGYILAQSLADLPSGEQMPLLLRQTVTCSRTAPPPAATAVDGLLLELRTAAGRRLVSLPVDRVLFGDAARACGFVPLGEAIDLQLYEAGAVVGALGLDVMMTNLSVEPAALVSLDAGPGLRAQVRRPDGSPAVLPLPLPPNRPGSQTGVYASVLVTVVDCALARTTPPEVELQFTDGDEQFRTTVDYLSSLLSTACPS